ncbi:hypothetical protein AB0G02_18460 [Actinosynnema sp. NPDC023658]
MDVTGPGDRSSVLGVEIRDRAVNSDVRTVSRLRRDGALTGETSGDGRV